MIKYILTSLFILMVAYANAQMDTTIKGNLIIIQDTAVTQLMNAKIVTMHPKTLKGYRLQLASSANRNEVEQLKTSFLQSHPQVRAYMSYQQPYFKLRVGDFEERTDANRFMDEIFQQFPGFIVPEIINTDSNKED